MTLRATTALLFVALVGSGCALVSTASCDFANTDQIEALLGENDLETLSVEGLDECVFTSVDDPAQQIEIRIETCLLYTSPSPRDRQKSRMPSSA